MPASAPADVATLTPPTANRRENEAASGLMRRWSERKDFMNQDPQDVLRALGAKSSAGPDDPNRRSGKRRRAVATMAGRSGSHRQRMHRARRRAIDTSEFRLARATRSTLQIAHERVHAASRNFPNAPAHPVR